MSEEKRINRWRLPLIIGSAVILTAAIGTWVGTLIAHHDSARPSAESATSTAVAVEPLDSPQAIARRLQQGGLSCTGMEPTTDPLNATARASCYNGQNQLVISTYASHDDVEIQWQDQKELLEGISELYMVLGDTWTVSTDSPADAMNAAQILGGEYRHL